MQMRVKRALEEASRKARGEIIFASLFGSYRRGDCDIHSDIDILLIHEDLEKQYILDYLKSLECVLGRRVHLNLFDLQDFKERIERQDYLMASLIDDSSFILGSRAVFEEARRSIFERCSSDASVRFNWDVGVKVLKHLCLHLDDMRRFGAGGGFLNRVINSLNDYRLALGYLLASRLMQNCGRGISYRHLIELNVNPILREIDTTERLLKRGISPSLDFLNKLVVGIKAEAWRLLEFNRHLSDKLVLPTRLHYAKDLGVMQFI